MQTQTNNIQHRISTTSIFVSDKYNSFCMITGNRGINMKKVERIIKDIEGGNDMLRYYPIQVRVNGSRLEILDGQHRFFVCKKLKREVHYIIVTEEKTMPDIAKVNSNVEKWAAKNFLDCYVTQGLPDYIELQSFHEKYGINIGVSVNLLLYGLPHSSDRGQSRSMFQEGRFQVKEREKAYLIAELAKKFEGFPSWPDKNFLQAVEKIHHAGKVTVDQLAAAYKNYPELLTVQAGVKQYIGKLEEIMNHRKQKRIYII